MAKNRVFVVGVGMTKFEKPGSREGWDYPQMANESGNKALADAGISYDQVEQGYVGYCSGDSTLIFFPLTVTDCTLGPPLRQDR